MQLSEEVGYVLYSALGSFYIPSCIMVFVYIRIYFAAKQRARRGIRKPPRKTPQDAVTSFSNVRGSNKNGTEGGAAGSVDRNSNTSPRDGERQIATIEAHPRPIIPTVTCDLASDVSTSDAAEILQEGSGKDTLKVNYLFFYSLFFFLFFLLKIQSGFPFGKSISVQRINQIAFLLFL